MYTYIYIYVCMCVCVYVCMYVSMYVCIYIYMYVCMYVYIHSVTCCMYNNMAKPIAIYCNDQPPHVVKQIPNE